MDETYVNLNMNRKSKSLTVYWSRFFATYDGGNHDGNLDGSPDDSLDDDGTLDNTPDAETTVCLYTCPARCWGSGQPGSRSWCFGLRHTC